MKFNSEMMGDLFSKLFFPTHFLVAYSLNFKGQKKNIKQQQKAGNIFVQKRQTEGVSD